jgi:hypothetical protein
MAIRTIYEISKPDVNFYAVERSGFTTVGEVVKSVVDDMLTLGAFTVSNLLITLSNTANLEAGANTIHAINTAMPGVSGVYSSTWPPEERVYSIVNGGAGYKVGDIVKIGNASTKIGTTPNILITSVNQSGTVTSIGLYDNAPYNAANPIRSVNETSFTSATSFTGYIESFGNVRNSNITAPTGTNVTPSDALIGSVESSNSTFTTRDPSYPVAVWEQANGVKGSQRWPGTGFWTQVLYSEVVNGNANIFVGQTITLNNFTRPDAVSGTSNIAPGTYITGIYPYKVVTGLTELVNLKPAVSNPNNTTLKVYGPWKEYTTEYTWFSVNKPVTINFGDNIALSGGGLTISNTEKKLPAGFRVIVEAGASVDPLNDSVGVYGAVSTSTSNSNIVQIKNLSTENRYNPVIYAGQTVTSTNDNGAIDGYVTVVSATPTGPTTANVVLSSNQTLPANETLHFVFAEVQPWRLGFDVVKNIKWPTAGSQHLLTYAATPVQLTNDGGVANIWADGKVIDRAGTMGARPTAGNGYANANISSEGFINREYRVQSNPEVYPLNYAMTLTNRGMFLGVWEGTWSTIQKSKARSTRDNDSYFNWFLIQRPVNRYTGKVLTSGLTPVFCINSVGYKYWKFIVREMDVLHPSLGDPENTYNYITGNTVVTANCAYRVPADYHTQDSFAVLNSTNQISLTEDSKYLVSFLHNLTTPRFRYSEELDMIGQTSADVCMAGNDVSITAYGESGPRMYHAMPANNPYNSGLRICVLKNIPT